MAELEQIVSLAADVAAPRLIAVAMLPALDSIADRIILLHGQRVMLDAQLARLYGVQTERLNQQVQRNAGRFPPDFAFRLSP